MFTISEIILTTYLYIYVRAITINWIDGQNYCIRVLVDLLIRVHYLNETRTKESILGMENEKVNHERLLCNPLLDIQME